MNKIKEENKLLELEYNLICDFIKLRNNYYTKHKKCFT